VKQYARLGSEIVRAAKAYAEEVRMGIYPAAAGGPAQAPTVVALK
jgi:ketopantoate hydroxymethyltransferase